METSFDPGLLERPAVAASENVIRRCVRCGFCTANARRCSCSARRTILRGRIYLMKDTLENDRPADALTVTYIDRGGGRWERGAGRNQNFARFGALCPAALTLDERLCRRVMRP